MSQDAGAAPVPMPSLQQFRAELEVFSGPLDLLLHLIRQEELSIFEVELSQITDRYLGAVRAMQLVDVNVAAEFVVVAATLMEIKSRTLLPPAEQDEQDEDDPGAELVRRLLEYKEIKEAARELGQMVRHRASRFARPRLVPEAEASPDDGPAALLEDLAAWDLTAAFAEVVEQTRFEHRTEIVRSDVPVSVYIEEVLAMLRAERRPVDFLEFFQSERSRTRVVGIFLALLELVRRKAIAVRQAGDHDRRIQLSLSAAA